MPVVVLVAVAALIILIGLDYAGEPVLGTDGIDYEHSAENLVHHSAFSPASQPPFYPGVERTPGYPAFLVPFEVLANGSLVWVRIAQFALVAALAMLTALVAEPLVGRRTALVAAILCATYIPFLLLASFQLTEVAATFLVVLMMLVAVRAANREAGLGACALTGAIGAVLAEVRPSLALLTPVVALAVVVASRGPWMRARIIRGVTVLAVFGLLLVPWTIRNASVADRLIPLGTLSSQSLYFSLEQYLGKTTYAQLPADSDALAADGTQRLKALARAYDSRPHDTDVARGTLLQVQLSDSYSDSVRDELKELTAGDVVGDVPRRLQAIWGTADLQSPRLQHSWLHQLAKAQYVLLLLLAAAGAVLLRRRWRELWPLWLVPAYLTALHFIYQAEARYTIPARSFVLVFAAAAVVMVWERTWEGRRVAAG